MSTYNLCTMYTVVEVYYCIHVGGFDMGLDYVGIQSSSYGGWLKRHDILFTQILL